MGRLATEGNKSTKKRWRIGGKRNKSNSKDCSVEDDSGTASTTPESSDRSNDSHESCEEHNVVNELLSTVMSEVDDSDSDDDDLYLDNDNDPKDTDEITAPLKASQPTNDGDDDGCVDDEDERSNSNCPNIELEASNIDDHGNDDHEDRDNNYKDDMKRHKKELGNSPHFSKELANISEEQESHYTCDTDGDDAKFNIDSAGHDDDYDIAPKTEIVDRVVSRRPEEIYRNKDGEEIILPSFKKLSKELCKIVATEHYSGQESLRTLDKLSEWAHTQDSNLLKHFLTYGGVVKVVDFLNEQIEDDACEGDYLMESIHKAADVICNVCFVGKHGINEDIAVVNATVVVKYGGIQTLLLASDAYTRSNNKNDRLALKAAEGVWNAIMNVYCNAEAAVTKRDSLLVLDASVEMMSSVGSIDDPIAAETLANVFNSLYRITYHDFVTKEEFQQKEILKHCLGVFKRDVTSSEGDEELLEEVMSFLYGCHEMNLFDKGADYERVLPLCVMGLREFAHANDNIRQWATKLLDGACSNIEKKESMMMAEGAIEVLAPFLTSKDIDAAEKEELRNLIRKIVAV